MTQLPQLPLSPIIVAEWTSPTIQTHSVLYTAEQMQAYGQACREAALEDAAKVAEGHYGDGFRLAEELRALK